MSYNPGNLQTSLSNIAVNANFTAIDDTAQEIASAVMGDPLTHVANLDNVASKLQDFETFLGDLPQNSMGRMDMQFSMLPIATAAYAREEQCNTISIATNKWTHTAGVPPFTCVRGIVTLNATEYYFAIAGKIYRSTRNGLQFSTTGQQMLIASNTQRGDLTGRRKRSWPSFGAPDGNRFYAEGIGAPSLPVDDEWVPEAGDIFHCQDRELTIKTVSADYIEFVDEVPLSVGQGPEWYIEGGYEPYIGLVDYDEDLIHDQGVVVLATFDDGTMDVVTENQAWVHYEYLRGKLAPEIGSVLLRLSHPCSAESISIKRMRTVVYCKDYNMRIFNPLARVSPVPLAPDQGNYLVSSYGNEILMRQMGETLVDPRKTGNTILATKITTSGVFIEG